MKQVGIEIRAPGSGTETPATPVTDRVASAWQALRGVYDPELCIDIVSLGLVYGVFEEGDKVVVEMTLTTVGCPASENLPAMAECAVSEMLGSAAPAEIRLVWDPPWDPSMMHADSGFQS